MNYKVSLVSMGCAKNLIDSETMLGLLLEAGCTMADNPAEADIVIVNTCGFTNDSKEESIETLYDMQDCKEYNCKVFVIAGCLAERYPEEIKKMYEGADVIIGTGDFDKIVEAVEKALKGEKVCEVGHPDHDMAPYLPRALSTPPYMAYIKIADGCDNHCTYCAIPKMRGRYRSRTMEEILHDARELGRKKRKELILVAQDTTNYGKDIYGKPSLDILLDELAKTDGLEWIRAHYFYPEEITDSLLEVMAKHDNICNYIDMPVQHASDSILRRMGRRTSRADMEDRIRKIRELMPDCTIRTSIIVGFPGETEEDFEILCDFVKQVKFDRLGVFKYSQEDGTPAAEFENQIPEEIKQERLDILMGIQQEISLKKNQEKIGSVIEVMVTGYDEDSFLFVGRSRGDSVDVDGLVYFATEEEVEAGDLINVKILDADEYDLTGERVYEEQE